MRNLVPAKLSDIYRFLSTTFLDTLFLPTCIDTFLSCVRFHEMTNRDSPILLLIRNRKRKTNRYISVKKVFSPTVNIFLLLLFFFRLVVFFNVFF